MLASPLGRFCAGNSFMHKLDARIKLLSIVVLIIATVAIASPVQLIIAWVFTAALIASSQLGIKPYLTCIKPVAPFIVIVAVFNLFVAANAEVLLSVGPLALTSGGIWAALLYASRLLIAVILGALLLLTTTPTALTDAFESLLSPLARFGVPSHEIALVLSLALRFVPILADETQSVIDAQKARGGSIEDGTFTERAQALGAVLIAVLAGAIRHAQNLSRALDARCYEGGENRTHYREHAIAASDIVFCALCIAYLAAELFIPLT